MKTSKIGLAIVVLVLAGAAITIGSQRRSLIKLHGENALLRQEILEIHTAEQRQSERREKADLSQVSSFAPPRASSARDLQQEPEPATNRLAQIMREGAPPLMTAQLQRYLDENHRSAASLVSAYRTSGDSVLLREAMEKYPTDPTVAFEAAVGKDVSPTERREWLEAFKKLAPDNPLANYLSALDHFKSGRTDQAVLDLLAANDRPTLTDYTVERIRMDEEAYRAAGYSEGEAKMAAVWGVPLPQVAQMKALAQEMVGLAASYRQAGDENSAQATLQMAIALGQKMDASSTGASVPIISRLVGVAIQRMAFDAMDPGSGYGEGTVQQQLDQLKQRKDSIRQLVRQSSPFHEQMTPDDWLTYNERTLSFGEENAIGWLLNKYAQK